jgi:hypothetical protein
MALPVNEYLFAIIIAQLSIKLPLLAAWQTSFACPKEVSRKRHPTMPALRAPLCCSPVAGRQKLADAQTGLVPYSATSCSAASNGGHPICAFLSQVRVFRKDQNNNIINKDFKPRGYPSGNDSRIARSSG